MALGSVAVDSEGAQVMSVSDALAMPYALVGGAAGLALLGYIGSVYHNWYLRRELRRIRVALERREDGERLVTRP